MRGADSKQNTNRVRTVGARIRKQRHRIGEASTENVRHQLLVIIEGLSDQAFERVRERGDGSANVDQISVEKAVDGKLKAREKS